MTKYFQISFIGPVGMTAVRLILEKIKSRNKTNVNETVMKYYCIDVTRNLIYNAKPFYI